MKALSPSPHPGSQVPWKQRRSAWTANTWPAMGSVPGPVQLWPPWFGWLKTLNSEMISPLVLAAIALLWLFKDQSHPGSYFCFFRWNPFILPQPPIRCLGCFVCPQCPKFPWNGLFSLTIWTSVQCGDACPLLLNRCLVCIPGNWSPTCFVFLPSSGISTGWILDPCLLISPFSYLFSPVVNHLASLLHLPLTCPQPHLPSILPSRLTYDAIPQSSHLFSRCTFRKASLVDWLVGRWLGFVCEVFFFGPFVLVLSVRDPLQTCRGS